jgi:hypothetical protein
VLYGWSVASTVLQQASIERTLAAAKEWAEEQTQIPDPEWDDCSPQPRRVRHNTADHCAECQTLLEPNRYNLTPANGLPTFVRA